MAPFLFNLYKRPSRTFQDLEKLKGDKHATEVYMQSLSLHEQFELLAEIASYERDIPYIEAELKAACFSVS